jgi:hypothetical protein
LVKIPFLSPIRRRILLLLFDFDFLCVQMDGSFFVSFVFEFCIHLDKAIGFPLPLLTIGAEQSKLISHGDRHIVLRETTRKVFS